MSRLISNANYTRADIAGIVLVATIWGERLLYYVRSVLLRLPIIGNVAKPFITVVIITVILFTFRYVKNKIKLFDVLFVFGVMMLYLLHLAFYTENADYLLENLPYYLTVCLPMFLLGVVCDIDKCMNVLIKVSLAYVYLGVLYYYYVTFAVGTYEMDTSVDQMGIAYQYLPHVLLLLYATVQKFNVWRLSGVLLGSFMILGTGNRGSLLLIIIFAAAILLMGAKRNKWVKVVGFILMAVLAININSVALFFSDVMGDFGLSVRSLNYFLEDNFIDDNGRDDIQRVIISAIQNSPLFGYGLAGDRVLLRGIGVYSHNIVYEFLISFGIPLGLLLLASVFALLYIAFRKCTTSSQRGFFFVLLCTGFLQLFMSNTFLSEAFFYLLLGYCVMIIRTSKKSINTVINEESIYHLLPSGGNVVSGILPE